MKRIQFLWRYASHWKLRIILSLLALTFVSLTSLLYPWLVKQLVDEFAGGAPDDNVTQLLALSLLGVLLLSTVVGYYQQITFNTLGLSLRNKLRSTLYEAVLEKPLGFFRQSTVGEVSALATEELAKVQPLFSHLVAPLFQNAMFVVGCIGLMMYLNWLATLFVLLVMMVPLPYVLKKTRQIRPLSEQAQRSMGSAHALLEETMVAIREIKAFLRERLEVTRYAKELATAMNIEMASSTLRVKISQGVYLLLSMVLLAVFYAGASKTLFPNWTIGDLIAFYFYAYMLTMAVIASERIYLTYQEVAGAIDRTMFIVDESAPIASPASSSRGSYRGNIKFESVSFAYIPGQDVLQGVSFEVEPGCWVLIEGPSGSGKSTLVSLLMGFHTPRAGRILIDGEPLDDSSVRFVRQEFGFVGQEPFLIHGTLRENLAFADKTISEESIGRALSIACLDDLLSELPDGLETLVGERGYTLSGGQKARVAIARAIVFDPAVLILDEATVMLEAELEFRLWEKLLASRSDKTTLIITHHSERVPRIDQSISLAGGRLSGPVASGDPALKTFAKA